MIKFLIFAVFLVGCYASNLKIVNGTNAIEGEFPYVVSLRRNNSHICGGSILNKDFILTAAHCVCYNNTPNWDHFYTVQYGSVEITLDLSRSIPVKTIYCNDYSSIELVFDTAVLELESSLPENSNWVPAKLAKEFDTSVGIGGATIVGWGFLWANGPTPANLQKLTVEIYSNAVCEQISIIDIEHEICLGADLGGACQGDSGTALLVEDLQIGISSFIFGKCGFANVTTPNVYARVSRYYNWIASIAGLD